MLFTENYPVLVEKEFEKNIKRALRKNLAKFCKNAYFLTVDPTKITSD